MSKLTKSIYGYETDPKKTPFGLLNNQVKLDSVINNAGWFNAKGERLGSGDLSLKDMNKIAGAISSLEGFFVLSEADSSWNLPSYLDASSPGFDYVINNASWIVAKRADGKGIVIRARDDIEKPENTKQDGIDIVRIPRAHLIKVLANHKKVDDAVVTKTNRKELIEKAKKVIAANVVGVPAISLAPIKKIGGFQSVKLPTKTKAKAPATTGGSVKLKPKQLQYNKVSP